MEVNATEDKDKLADMPYIKLYTGDIDVLGKCFSPAQIGTLLLAVNAYAKDGTIQDVPAELRYPLHEYVEKIKASRKKYAAICAKRAVAASKGGRAKAAKNHAQTVEQEEPEAPQEPKFKAPTRRQFMDTFRVLRSQGLAEGKNQQIGDFYSKLAADAWTYCGAPIGTEEDLRALLRMKFYPKDPKDEYGELPVSLWGVFYVLTAGGEGRYEVTPGWISKAAETVNAFFDAYDEERQSWMIAGKAYHRETGAGWVRLAVEAFAVESGFWTEKAQT